MTIFCIKGKEVAADSALWNGDIIVSHDQPKIMRIPPTSSFGAVSYGGCAGTLPYTDEFNKWLLSGAKGEYPKNPNGKDDKEGFKGFILSGSGEYLQIFEGVYAPHFIKVPFYAIGADREFALGALAAGATPKTSVELCIKHCSYSAGSAISVTLD